VTRARPYPLDAGSKVRASSSEKNYTHALWGADPTERSRRQVILSMHPSPRASRPERPEQSMNEAMCGTSAHVQLDAARVLEAFYSDATGQFQFFAHTAEPLPFVWLSVW